MKHSLYINRIKYSDWAKDLTKVKMCQLLPTQEQQNYRPILHSCKSKWLSLPLVKSLWIYTCVDYKNTLVCWFSWVLFHILSQKHRFAAKLSKKCLKSKICSWITNKSHQFCKQRVALKQFQSLPALLQTYPTTTICFNTKIKTKWFKTSRK